MRASVPKYNEVVHELLSLMEVCMAQGGSRKKSKLNKISLKDCGWNQLHDQALDRPKKVLMQMVPLAHPKEDSDVCVFTDASQDHWEAVVAQVPPGDLSKPREEQQHEPLAFFQARSRMLQVAGQLLKEKRLPLWRRVRGWSTFCFANEDSISSPTTATFSTFSSHIVWIVLSPSIALTNYSAGACSGTKSSIFVVKIMCGVIFCRVGKFRRQK
jgi:hypothetical protein